MRPARGMMAIAAVLLPSTVAVAHDAQRMKYVAAVHIAAPPQKVWAVIGHFGDLSWNDQVAATKAQGGDTPDAATRTVTLKRGGVLPAEELVRYEPDTLSYATFLPHVDVHVFPVTNYSSILVVLPEGTGSRVEWRSAYYRGYPNFGPPPELNEAAATRAVAALTQPALDGLKTRIEAATPTN